MEYVILKKAVNKPENWEEVVRVCIEYFNVERFGTLNKKGGKWKKVSKARNFAVYIIYTHFHNITLCQIRDYFGYKNHTSIYHCIKTIDGYMDAYPEIKAEYQKIMQLLGLNNPQ